MTQTSAGWFAAAGFIVVLICAVAHAARHVYCGHRDFKAALDDVRKAGL